MHLHGIPFHWKTKITDFKDDQGTQKSFVDFQEKGPYRLWQHEHTFEKIGTGTLVRDWVRYEIPLGKAGMIAAGWKVDADVSKIFDYRREHIAKLI